MLLRPRCSHTYVSPSTSTRRREGSRHRVLRAAQRADETQPRLPAAPPAAQPAAPQSGGVLINGLVAVMTESLRALGVGRREYERIRAQPLQLPALAPGDINGLLDRLRSDFERAYFVTGVIDDSIYESDCFFGDPTVSFTGLDTWKRNLQLLVPFLVAPRIELHALERVCSGEQQQQQQLRAEWTLDTGLALPWRPRVAIRGRTLYTLSLADAPDALPPRICRHVESWDVSAGAALLQMFTPGKHV